MVWLKIRKHDIELLRENETDLVVVWLKIRKHDIFVPNKLSVGFVVVWLKIRKHDIQGIQLDTEIQLWFD